MGVIEQKAKEALKNAGNAAKSAATEKIAAYTSEEGKQKRAEKREESFQRQLKWMSKVQEGHRFLWMKSFCDVTEANFRNIDYSNYHFTLFDANRNIHYTVNGVNDKTLQNIAICDAKGNALAYLREIKTSRLKERFHMKADRGFYVEFHGQLLGGVFLTKTRIGVTMKVNFNGWVISSKLGGSVIKDPQGNVIATVSSKLIGLSRYYFIDYLETENKTLIVALSMVVHAWHQHEVRNQRHFQLLEPAGGGFDMDGE